MKKSILLILFMLFISIGNAQESVKQYDISASEMNYVFSRKVNDSKKL